MSVIHAPKKPELDLRVVAFPGLMLLLMGILFLRLWYIQVVRAPELLEKAAATRETHLPRTAPRGLIYDRNMNLIAGVRPELAITVVYKIVHKNLWVVPKLASLLGVDEKKLLAKINLAQRQPNLPVPVYVGASMDVGAKIAEAAPDELPGIGVNTEPMRYYLDTTSFSNILGYVGIPSRPEVDAIRSHSREPANYVGKQGLERHYELDLMGDPGAEHIEIDAKRRPLRVVGRDEPVPGKQLILSIDGDLQKYMTALMKLKGFVGAVVAIDPTNGEVLCMVSSPSFDQSLFSSGIKPQDWQRLEMDPNHPLVNRTIGASYSPGSTFKIVTSLAAYEQGKLDLNRYFYCPGGYRLGTRFFKCLGHHGSISWDTAFTKSCNTYFASLGYLVGPDAIRTAALEVGLGAKTGLDIGGESKGVVPTDAWMERTFKRPHWYGGDTVNMSIGQGYIRTTPIQMANLACMVANDGVCYEPHLVRAIRDMNDAGKLTTLEPVVAHKVAGPEFWEIIKKGMFDVVDHGTGAGAKIPGIAMGGKTGSTEHGKGKKTHGWFVGLAPLDHPKICVCVLVEQAGHGGDVSAPIAREVFKHYLLKPAATRSNSAAAASASAALPVSPSAR